MPVRTYLILLALNIMATYVSRVLPFHVQFLSRLPRFAKKCMEVLPIAALGALIFPGVITDFIGEGSVWYAGLAGTLAAALVARKTNGLLLPVVSSFIVTWGILTFLG
ncbi:AzlD domain-containing protein [Parasphaerochaeta coccoides]|uniref:Branched-chain amino acid transport n=1 Tax=Parasphaerochaeta coccoides (strain ATCC BAA-1237 / DSM 17374 / SPN1) TaxID=760011 RepID=F4GH99_PARC1|nr:AzlD domain-containing protein [Parasphaerochaeta coccoides]AEC01998.1 branched-chain amino acid transport [Parasphaerochaeta coccoides DSM 17374]